MTRLRGAAHRPRWECYTHHITYLLTPWSRVLLEKLTGSAANQEIPRIFGTRRFLTVLTSARHLSLSLANSFHVPKTMSLFLLHDTSYTHHITFLKSDKF